MHVNTMIRRRMFQWIIWTWEDRDHWGFGYGSWPSGKTWEECRKRGLTNIRFHGFKFGIFEIRYWPNRQANQQLTPRD